MNLWIYDPSRHKYNLKTFEPKARGKPCWGSLSLVMWDKSHSDVDTFTFRLCELSKLKCWRHFELVELESVCSWLAFKPFWLESRSCLGVASNYLYCLTALLITLEVRLISERFALRYCDPNWYMYLDFVHTPLCLFCMWHLTTRVLLILFHQTTSHVV